MKKYNLQSFKRGWFAGDFEPSVFKTPTFEAGVKRLPIGYAEKSHFHKLSSELTLIVSGQVLMNGVEYGPDDIVVMEPGEATDFLCLTDVVTCVVRDASKANDKYEEI